MRDSWDYAPCSLVEIISVSEVRTTSIIRVISLMIDAVSTSETSVMAQHPRRQSSSTPDLIFATKYRIYFQFSFICFTECRPCTKEEMAHAFCTSDLGEWMFFLSCFLQAKVKRSLHKLAIRLLAWYLGWYEVISL
jgi:hypothetical protein